MATAHQSIGYTGVNVTFEAANANPVFGGLDGTSPGFRTFLWVKNTDAASRTVSVAVPGSTFGQANPDVSVVVPSGSERLIGPLVPELINDVLVALGLFVVSWGYSATSNVTIAVVDLPTPPPDLP